MSSWYDKRQEEEEEEFEEELGGEDQSGGQASTAAVAGGNGSDRSYWQGLDAILFVVDVSADMQAQDFDEGKQSYIQAAIRAVVDVMKSKIIMSESDLVGVMLYGTRERQNSLNHDHVYLLFDLDEPDVDRMLQLETLEQNPNQLETLYGSSNNYSLADVLWNVSAVFSKSTKKISTKRVFLITNQDDPNSDNSDGQRSARIRMNDLHDLGIRVELFGFNQPSHPFNYDTFYKHTIEHTNPDDGEEVDGNNTSSTTSLDPESRPAFCALSKFKEFKAIIHKKEFKKRSMFAIKFHLHNGLEIGVKGYNLYMEQKKAPFTHVHRESNRQVEPKSSFLCSDTTQILLPTDLKYFYSYGGEKIVFTKEELADIKTFGEPGLHLLGFKPRSALAMYENVKSSTFLFPDDGKLVGSSSLFIHLVDRMLHLDKIAICRFSPRHFSSPSIVALLPQRENGSDVYSGFHVITLPFVDEFRTVPNNLKIEVGQGSGNSGGGVDEQLVDLAKVVVERTMFKEFNPKSVENIALQHHYAYLQAIALKRDEPEYCEDKTMPKWERIKKRTGSQIADFNKRARAVMLEERGSVCAKEEDDENGEDDENERIEKLVKRNNRNGTLEKVLFTDLKKFLKNNGVAKPPAKKADCLELVKEKLGY